jgi:hypothetical protein
MEMIMHGKPERRAALAAAAFLAILAILAIGPADAAAGEVKSIDGVPHVISGAEPSGGVRTLALEELWRAGGDDDEIFFGSVQGVQTGPDGNIYLLDSQLSEVHVYSPTGEHLRVLCREGEGPGEVRAPGDMFFHPDGTLGVAQTFPGKVVKVRLDGEPAGTMAMGAGEASQGQFGVLVRTLARGGTIAFVGMRMSFTGPGQMAQNMFASRCDAEGNELHRFLEKSFPIDFNNFVMSEFGLDFVWSGRIALDDQGRVYLGEDRDAYRVKVYTPDGELVRVFERPYEPWPRDDRLKSLQRRTLEGVARNYQGAILRETVVAETEPAIAGMTVDEENRIWILPSRGAFERAPGVLCTYDVFDGEGHFRERVALRGPGDPSRDFVFLLPGGRVVVVTSGLDAYFSMQGVTGDEGDEIPPLEVICYRTSG